MNLQGLQKKYPEFIYEKYSHKFSSNNLEIFFDFKIPPDIKFKPKIIIKNVNNNRLKKVGERGLNNLIFHLGLIEIPSYWKATCSPKLTIKAGYLNREQINWWKDLIIKGMGQYFYENRIDFTKPDFLTIISAGTAPFFRFEGELQEKYLVPMGGGRDSIVTFEELRKKNRKINCFLVNPSSAAKKVIETAGVKNSIIVERKIDPVLLKLNKKGFLNGHTPFTALLSFLSVFCAILFDYKNIAFSNEKSADEGNVKYLGKIINHQWSKSSEFERKFKYYCKKYLSQNINYFSYLRSRTELEISKTFTKYPQYFSVFSSCNIGQKTGERWCGNCPKCLFIYATLYPFLEKKQFLKIFGKDLFENKKLVPVMKALIGQGKAKPFECVGTFKESRLAFNFGLQKARRTGKIPYLLTKLK
ncbi:MAG: hypothetical protein Q7S82_04080 [bacterium]|nr:hypothetical protein [bacterium]